MSRLKRYGASTTPLDRNGISVAQNTTATTALTMTGALSSVVSNSSTSAREFVGVNGRSVVISLYSAADMTAGAGKVVVTGFSDFARSQAITEDILLPNATYVLGSKHFAVVTGMVPDTSIAQNLEVGTDADATDATSSRIYIPLNEYASGYRIQVEVTGTITANVGVSLDPILDGTVTYENLAFVNVSGLDTIAATEQGTVDYPATMMHLTYSAATATEGAIITVVERK